LNRSKSKKQGERKMKVIKVTFVLSALALLSGCVAVPVNSGYYAPEPVYVAPAPVYYGAPAFYGPSIGIGIYGGTRGSYRGGYRDGYRRR
jgi:hypothetical protein